MKLALAGDIALHGLISSEPDLNGQRFKWLESLSGEYDGVLANLEVPVSGGERNRLKQVHLLSDPAVTMEILKRLNIICVSLANNHIMDCGTEGLRNTIALLDEAGIYHTGAGFCNEHVSPVIFSIGGIRIGFAAYADRSTHPGINTLNELHLNIFDVKKATEDIRGIREEADMVIISIHWGKDYSFYPEEWQVSTARQLVNSGADIIMGHHSHTLQPFETYGKGQIFYGLGSLTFGDFEKNGQLYALFRKTKNSAIFILNENCGITEAIPTHENKGNTIIRGRGDILKRNRWLAAVNRIRLKYRLINGLIAFNEDVLYRVYEYFFGYYMNPLKRLFQVGNIKKIKRLF